MAKKKQQPQPSDTEAAYLAVVGPSHGPLSPREKQAIKAWDGMGEKDRQAAPWHGNPAEYIRAKVSEGEGEGEAPEAEPAA